MLRPHSSSIMAAARKSSQRPFYGLIRHCTKHMLCKAEMQSSGAIGDAVLEDIRVVLVAPKGPANIGAVARVCANFEAPSLWVVGPRCDPYDGEVYKVSTVGADLPKQGTCLSQPPEHEPCR
jgi:tRNA G18 (ribose-2'-O)-methylase SpoU